KSMDHAVADEPVMVGVARRELRIRPIAVERAAQLFRHVAPHHDVVGLRLERDRREISVEPRAVGKLLAHDALLRLSCETACAPRARRLVALRWSVAKSGLGCSLPAS